MWPCKNNHFTEENPPITCSMIGSYITFTFFGRYFEKTSPSLQQSNSEVSYLSLSHTFSRLTILFETPPDCKVPTIKRTFFFIELIAFE